MGLLDRFNILIVDDEEMICDILTETFREQGARVKAVLSGEAALELLKIEKFDLVISDMYMPGLDGLSLVSDIKSRQGRRPHIFFISGRADITPEDARHYGIEGVISKPFDIDSLIAKTAKLQPVR